MIVCAHCSEGTGARGGPRPSRGAWMCLKRRASGPEHGGSLASLLETHAAPPASSLPSGSPGPMDLVSPDGSAFVSLPIDPTVSYRGIAIDQCEAPRGWGATRARLARAVPKMYRFGARRQQMLRAGILALALRGRLREIGLTWPSPDWIHYDSTKLIEIIVCILS